MTLVTIDINNVGLTPGPHDYVSFIAPNVREAQGGGLISTREEKVYLEEGLGEVTLDPGPVLVRLMCGGVLDTKDKLGVVPDDGPVTLEEVLEGALTWTPEEISRALDEIRGARDEALGQIGGAVDAEISEHLAGKADKTQLWNKGALGTLDLNTVTTPGFYDQVIPEYATVERGYPTEGGLWGLEVIGSQNVFYQQQRITRYSSSSANSTQRIYIRSWQTGTQWTQWRMVPTTVDLDAAVAGKSDRGHTHTVDAVEGAASVDYVDAQIQSAIPDPVDATTVDPSAFDILAGKLDFRGLGQLHIGVVGDSTMNDGNEMPRIFARSYGALLPENVRRVYHAWQYSASTWSNVIDAEGEWDEGIDGRILEDNFSRTGEIIGSSPDYGPVWEGAEGVWSGTGTGAVASATGLISADAGASTQTLDVEVSLVTTATGTAQSYRLYAASPTQSLSGRIMAAVTISATGYVSVAFYKIFGASEIIATSVQGADIGIAPNQAAPQEMSVKIDVDIQNITFTITGPGGSVTRTATITEAESTSLGTWAGIYAWTAATPGFTVTRASISTVPTPPSGNLLEMWNGAIAGGRMSTFHADQRAQMFGGKHVDVLILAMGHNHGAQSPEDFTTEITEWVTAWRAEHPETRAILWVSQNPKYDPAANIESHLHRQAAMRQVAFSQGWTYTPACEAYLAQPDGGSSLVLVDGVHPTSEGAILMADTLMAAVSARTVSHPAG